MVTGRTGLTDLSDLAGSAPRDRGIRTQNDSGKPDEFAKLLKENMAEPVKHKEKKEPSGNEHDTALPCAATCERQPQPASPKALAKAQGAKERGADDTSSTDEPSDSKEKNSVTTARVNPDKLIDDTLGSKGRPVHHTGNKQINHYTNKEPGHVHPEHSTDAKATVVMDMSSREGHTKVVELTETNDNHTSVPHVNKENKKSEHSLKMPSEKITNATPAQPATEATPAQPATEATPAQPATEATPAQPATEATPAQPAANATPAQPAANATPAQPAANATPAQPAANATPAQPAANATPAQPAANATPAQPATNATPAQPATNATPAQPATNATPAQLITAPEVDAAQDVSKPIVVTPKNRSSKGYSKASKGIWY
ncbi:hypothetical protein BVX99_03245 [bacterium F16]|nr:hypothetical protein BVX99_03245 [bacterium F16]